MRFLYLSIFVFKIFTASIFAQTGAISGIVVDGETGDGVIGCNIFIEGTTLGAAANINGKYTIQNVPAGTYTVAFSSIGYAKKSVTEVVVNTDKVTRIDIILDTESFQTDDVIITAEAVTNTEAALLAKRQKSVSVSDAISAEEISKSGSGDAAAAMKKVTGASVVGGKYVYVRGLGDRYSATMLNGAELPSADPDRKSFQLDLIPGSMLDNINTIKTFTPDKPGTFTGGIVDVTLKSYPEQLLVNFSTSTGYNTVATGNSNFILGNSGGTDWLGFDDGTRKIPSILDGYNIDIPRPNNVKNREDARELDAFSKAFNNVMSPSPADAGMNSSFGLSIGNTISLDDNNDNTIGYFGSITYGQKYDLVEGGEIGRYKLVGALSDVEGLEPEFTGIDTKGTRLVDWGAIANAAFKNSSIGEIKLSYMRTQSAESMGRYMVGYRDRDRTTQSSTVSYETRVISWVERALDNYMVEGKHPFRFLNNSIFDWKVSYSANTQDEPDQRYFFNMFRVNDDGSKLYSFDGANSQPISRFFRDLEETNFSTQANLTFPFKVWNDYSAKLKTGFYYSEVNREYNQRRFDYVENRIQLQDYSDNINEIFNDVGIIDSTSRPDRPSRWFGLTIDNQATRDSTNYFRGDSKVTAAYLMVDLPIFKDLRFIGGARLETTKINSWTLDKEDARGALDNSDILPSLNLIYSLVENMNLRFAYTNTIARPTFRELAPYISFEFVGDYLYIGKPNLQRTLIQNYDLRWEWFLNPGEIIAVSGFYKDFADPLESFIDPTFSDDNSLITIKNVESGIVYGVEFEVRKELGFLWRVLDNFKLGTNFSLIHSEINIPQEDINEKIANGDPNPDKTRPFPGQSPFLFNLNLTYDNFESQTSAGIYYYLFGDRLYATGRHATPDVFERGYGSLDIKVSQGLFDHFEISLTGQNLLNPKQIFSYHLKNGLVDKEFNYSAHRNGATFSFSISYKL